MPIPGVTPAHDNVSRSRASVPGWIASLALHAVLLVGSAIGLKSCQQVNGDGPGQFRQVGLVVKSPAVAPAWACPSCRISSKPTGARWWLIADRGAAPRFR